MSGERSAENVEGSYSVIAGEVIVTKDCSPQSDPIGFLERRQRVLVVEANGNRVRISRPVSGWCSIRNGAGEAILRKDQPPSRSRPDGFSAAREAQLSIQSQEGGRPIGVPRSASEMEDMLRGMAIEAERAKARVNSRPMPRRMRDGGDSSLNRGRPQEKADDAVDPIVDRRMNKADLEAAEPLAVGDHVDAKFKQSREPFPAVITKVHPDGHYDIEWRDGSPMDWQHKHRSRLFKVDTDTDIQYQVGDEVQACLEDGEWCAAIVMEHRDDGLFRIRWEDGKRGRFGRKENMKARSNIRPSFSRPDLVLQDSAEVYIDVGETPLPKSFREFDHSELQTAIKRLFQPQSKLSMKDQVANIANEMTRAVVGFVDELDVHKELLTAECREKMSEPAVKILQYQDYLRNLMILSILVEKGTAKQAELIRWTVCLAEALHKNEDQCSLGAIMAALESEEISSLEAAWASAGDECTATMLMLDASNDSRSSRRAHIPNLSVAMNEADLAEEDGIDSGLSPIEIHDSLRFICDDFTTAFRRWKESKHSELSECDEDLQELMFYDLHGAVQNVYDDEYQFNLVIQSLVSEDSGTEKRLVKVKAEQPIGQPVDQPVLVN